MKFCGFGYFFFGGKYDTMRYSEISQPSALNEAVINEAFLNDLAKRLGDKAKEHVTVVNNTVTTAQVLYKVCSNPSYLESMTFELKRAIKARLKALPNGKLKNAITNKFPQGRGLKDFFAALALISVLNTVVASKGIINDQALNVVINNVVNLDAIIGHLLSAGAGALGATFKALGVGNTVLFSVLTAINKKLVASTPTSGQPAPETTQGVVPYLAKNV